jgi:hypothetical protein
MKSVRLILAASASLLAMPAIYWILNTSDDTVAVAIQDGPSKASAKSQLAGAPAIVRTPSEEPFTASSSINPEIPDGTDAKERVWDLCGIGNLPIPTGSSGLADGGWSSLPKHLGDDAQDNARERLLLSLSQGDSRAQAAGLVLRQGYTQRFARASLELNAATDFLLQTQQALLTLAKVSRDPVVASWAVSICREDIPCRARANAVWRQLEPDNATPWMVELDLAPDNSTGALSAAAKSSRYSVYPGLIVGTALKAMPSDVPLYLQERLLRDVAIMEYASPRHHATRFPRAPIYNLCISTTDSTGQAVSSQATPQAAECGAIAQLFTERSDALESYWLGLTLSRSLGLPSAELEEHMEQAKLLQDASLPAADPQPYSCATAERSRAIVRDTANRGEINALRTLAAEKALQTAKRDRP